jgi:hypothetical protein
MPSGTTGPADAGSHDLRERLWALALSWRQFFGDPVSSHSIGARRTGFGCAEDLEALLKETAAASASAPAARPHFRCSEGCGVVAVDEDGCCRTCGADASASAGADASASAPAVPRETTKEEKADMSPGSTAKANPKGSAPVGPACVCHQGSVCGPACLIGVCHTGCFSWPTPPETK